MKTELLKRIKDGTKYLICQKITNKTVISTEWFDTESGSNINNIIEFKNTDFNDDVLLKLLISYLNWFDSKIFNEDIIYAIDYYGLAPDINAGYINPFICIDIVYYNDDGYPFHVELPQFISLFENIDEGISCMLELIEEIK